MSNILSQLGGGLADLASLAGRGFWGAATLGATELARANKAAEEAKQQAALAQIGNVLSGQGTPEFMRPGTTTDSLSPEAFDQEKMRQLYTLGTPEAAKIATQFTETPDSRLQKANVESELANRLVNQEVSRGNLAVNQGQLALEREDKLRNYNLAVKALEQKLKTGGMTPNELFDNTTKLRNEFVTQSKDFSARRDAYDNIQSLASDGSGSSDTALMIAFMKLQDPTSVVSGNEAATVANSPGVPERVRAQYNRLLEGDKLTGKSRQELTKTAKATFDSSLRQHEKRIGQYKGLAERVGVPSDQVILDLGLADGTPKAKNMSINTGGWSIKPLGGK